MQHGLVLEQIVAGKALPRLVTNKLKEAESNKPSWYHFALSWTLACLQPDGISKAKQGVKADYAVKAYRKLREEDLGLEPLCDEVVLKVFIKLDIF